MLKNNKAYIKLLVSTAVGLMLILSSLVMSCQGKKISQLEDELYLKRQNEQRATDYYESTLNIKTIQSKFNTLKEYSVQKNCTINMNHRYEYSSEGAFGIKHQVVLVGDGQLQYDINVRFDTAIVSSMNNGRDIKIQIQKPYVDEDSIKLVENTLVMREQDCNFWSNKHDGIQAQKFYMESFVDSGRENILDLYKTKDKQNYINKVAVAEVQALVRTLNLNNCNVIVEIIE